MRKKKEARLISFGLRGNKKLKKGALFKKEKIPKQKEASIQLEKSGSLHPIIFIPGQNLELVLFLTRQKYRS